MSTLSPPYGQESGTSATWSPSGSVRNVAEALVFLVLLWAGWRLTATPITLTVDGEAHQVDTHRHAVENILVDMGLDGPEWMVLNGSEIGYVQESDEIRIGRERPVRILLDGRDLSLFTTAKTLRQVLSEGMVSVEPYDRVFLDGEVTGLDENLPPMEMESESVVMGAIPLWKRKTTRPLQIQIVRSLPIQVDDGTIPFTVRTTAQTVGEALREAEITLYLGDTVQPSLGSPVSTGLKIFIRRSTPVSVHVDGRRNKTRVLGQTVGDALTEMGIGVSGLDRVEPPLDTPLYQDMPIRVVRISEEIEVEEEIVPFDSAFRPDPNLLIDTRQVVNQGAAGITRSRYRVRVEDGVEVDRQLEDTWVAQEPAQRVIAYGQNIVPQTATVEGQTLTYWRKIRMAASSYSASTAGVSPDVPWYGITRTGDPMRFGIVAVDPAVIPLRSLVYVPGYGEGEALDTGSAIISRRIDLGYDDDNLVLWSRWVDVYLLWPPPNRSQITWVLPNWPVEK